MTANNISVVCPTFNSASFIEIGLCAIARQSCLPLEVVVSDDGSNDDTCDVVRRFARSNPKLNIILIRNSHAGPGAARNAGIKAAKGEWIAFLDSDDSWMPHKLQRVVMILSTNPDGNFVCHNQEQITLFGRRSVLDFAGAYNSQLPLGRQLLRQNLFTPSAVVCRRDLLIEEGLFNEQLMSAQDYELWLRLSPKLRVIMIPEVLGTYLERKGSITYSYNWRYLRNCFRLLYWHRKKGGNGVAFASAARITAHYLFHRARKTVRAVVSGT